MRKIKSLFFSSLVFVMLLGCFSTHAQTDKFLVDLADEMYDFGDFEDAIGVYLQAIDENEDNIRANYQLGECYLKTSHSKIKAIDYFLRAHDLDPEYTNMILFKIAESYRFNHQFDDAITYYKLFKEEVEIHRRIFEGLDTEELRNIADRRVYECVNAKDFIDSPTSVQIENLGGVVNSEHNEYAPVISSDNKTLIFTSRRPGGIGILKDVDNKYFEDLWVSTYENGSWSQPKNLGEPVNSDNHESNLCLSPSGDKLYLYKTENSGDIFLSEKVNGQWSAPKSLGKPINTEYKEISAFETTDGQKLFISSDRPGGIGKADIYVSNKNEKGEWGEPVLLSDVINTPLDEEGPFFITESNTLYFSSKGHRGMGGYDLYRSQYTPETDTWSEPQNLGYPINSTDDDLYFTMSSDGKTGYYATFKEDSRGENDIYRIFPADGSTGEKDTDERVVATPAVDTGAVTLNFKVYDYDTREPIIAQIDLVNKDTDEKLFSGEINGSFVFPFQTKNSLMVILLVESEGYLFQTVKINIPEPSENPVRINKELGLRKPKSNVANIMRNVYFDFSKATLKKESYNEIDKLVKMLNENPKMKIEINGHTDFIGGAAYNKELSRQRASAVRDYLIKKGIDQSRVTAVGYGSERPLASNDDEEEGRELNRRTEFTIISQ